MNSRVWRGFMIVLVIVCMLIFLDIIPLTNQKYKAGAYLFIAMIFFFQLLDQYRSKYSVKYNKRGLVIKIDKHVNERSFQYDELESFERTPTKLIFKEKSASPYEINIEDIDPRSINKLVDILESNGVSTN